MPEVFRDRRLCGWDRDYDGVKWQRYQVAKSSASAVGLKDFWLFVVQNVELLQGFKWRMMFRLSI